MGNSKLKDQLSREIKITSDKAQNRFAVYYLDFQHEGIKSEKNLALKLSNATIHHFQDELKWQLTPSFNLLYIRSTIVPSTLCG